MLRKTLIALSAAAALGVSSGAMAASHGGHGASSGSSMSVAPSSSGSGPGPGRSGIGPSAPGPVTPMSPSQLQPKGPGSVTSQVRPMGPSNWHGRHHHRHDRFFFGAGFAGPYYDDYGYDSCWRIVPTYYGGWRRVWVCGDYPYGGYYGGY